MALLELFKGRHILVGMDEILNNNIFMQNIIFFHIKKHSCFLLFLELDCMEAFLDLNPLLRNTSPILRVFKSESPFVNQRKKREVPNEYSQPSPVRPEGTQK